MFRAQLHLCTGTHDETLPQLALAIQQLNCHCQAYPDAVSNLQDTPARDHFIDALPESEGQWHFHQARPKSLQEELMASEREAICHQ